MDSSRSRLPLLSFGGALSLALGVATIGCAGARQAEVDDSWLARVPPENLSGVYEARASFRQSRDEVTRAEVARQDAERELGVARLERDAAQAHAEAGKAVVEAARAKGQAGGIQAAQRDLREAEMALSVAEAQVQWREEQVDAREAEREWKARLADVDRAKLSLAEYQALKEAGDVRAAQLSEAEFREAVAKAQKEAAEEQKDVEKERREAQNAHARWTQRQQSLEGYGGSGPTQ
ncbi:MAG: hypothetical protein M3Y59_12125 [Myxococcota bacterium]|nr:hypothetical protein [Myxococcota bacterium]